VARAGAGVVQFDSGWMHHRPEAVCTDT
jgi:hypothetical protein